MRQFSEYPQDYVFLTGGFKQITTAAKEAGTDVPHEHIFSSPITITQPGYVYIYLSNENTTPVEVFFDEFKVTHTKSPVIQMDDYYPFGLAFNSYNRENAVEQKYLYNGKELQDELNLSIYDYGARSYDPAIGRWWQIDPLSELSRRWSPFTYCYNNPIIFVDPDGMFGDYFTTSGQYLGNDGIDDNKVYEVANVSTVSSNSEGNIVANNNELGGPVEIGVRSDFLNMNGKEITSDETKNNLIGLSINMKNEGTTEGYATITVTGGDRDGASNANANGAAGSRHLSGDAADIAVAGMSNKDLSKAADASGLFSSVIYYPNWGDTGNFGTHDVTTKDAEGKEVVTQELNFQKNGPHAHVDNGPTKKSAKEYTGHKSSKSSSGTYKKLD